MKKEEGRFHKEGGKREKKKMSGKKNQEEGADRSEGKEKPK